MELLVKVCKKHRSKLPAYLKSAQEEVQRIDAVLDKLLAAANGRPHLD